MLVESQVATLTVKILGFRPILPVIAMPWSGGVESQAVVVIFTVKILGFRPIPPVTAMPSSGGTLAESQAEVVIQQRISASGATGPPESGKRRTQGQPALLAHRQWTSRRPWPPLQVSSRHSCSRAAQRSRSVRLQSRPCIATVRCSRCSRVG